MFQGSGFTNITQPLTDRLTYAADGHKYYLDGIELTSVTTMLKNCGLVDIGFYTEAGADNGKRRHKVTELMDLGTLDWGSVLEEDLPYAQGWADFCRDYEFKPLYIEQRVYHETYLYAGTIDRIGMVKGRPAIVDLKTGSKLERWVELQLLLYALMISFGEERPDLWAVHLRPGKTGYRAVQYDYSSLEVALSILRINSWRSKNG